MGNSSASRASRSTAPPRRYASASAKRSILGKNRRSSGSCARTIRAPPRPSTAATKRTAEPHLFIVRQELEAVSEFLLYSATPSSRRHCRQSDKGGWYPDPEKSPAYDGHCGRVNRGRRARRNGATENIR